MQMGVSYQNLDREERQSFIARTKSSTPGSLILPPTVLPATHWGGNLANMGLVDGSVGQRLSPYIVLFKAVRLRWGRTRAVFVHYHSSVESTVDVEIPLPSSAGSGNMVKMSTTSLGSPKLARPTLTERRKLTQTCRVQCSLRQLARVDGRARHQLLQQYDVFLGYEIHSWSGKDRRKVSGMFLDPDGRARTWLVLQSCQVGQR